LIVILQIASVLLNVVWWIIFIQTILSILIAFNVINTYNEFVSSVWQGLNRLTEPVYRPLRRILPDAHPLDLAPLAVLVIIYILNVILIPRLEIAFIQAGIA
jgi:YggT family protein